MSYPDDFIDKDEGEQGGGTTGRGAAGKVEVRIATMVGDSRDEPRTPQERRRFAMLHETTQAERVRRARERKKALAQLREQGPVSLNQRQAYVAEGGGGHKASPYKAHPISQTAYFSGAEESPVPSDNRLQDVNDNDREKLEDRPENKLQNRLALKNAPKYSSTPKLRRY